jgi:hypothetical protein
MTERTSVRLEFGPDFSVEGLPAPSPSASLVKWKERLMKNLLITITATLVCVGAYGQGKLAFMTDDLQHLIYFATDKALLAPADANTIVNGYPLAGSGLYTGPDSTIAALAGSPTIIAGLWAGTSDSSLSLQITTAIDTQANEGQVVRLNVMFGRDTPLSLPANVPAWFQVQVYDSRATSASDAWANMEYGGASQVFQATPLLTTYPPLNYTEGLAYSTWAPGTFELVDQPGYFGAIEVRAIPEPGTFALVSLSTAALMIARRRR